MAKGVGGSGWIGLELSFFNPFPSSDSHRTLVGPRRQNLSSRSNYGDYVDIDL